MREVRARRVLMLRRRQEPISNTLHDTLLQLNMSCRGNHLLSPELSSERPHPSPSSGAAELRPPIHRFSDPLTSLHTGVAQRRNTEMFGSNMARY